MVQASTLRLLGLGLGLARHSKYSRHRDMVQAERDRVGTRLLWLSLAELFTFRFMQTDPNWSNFLYEPRSGQLSLIDFGACQQYEPEFADNYLRLVRACADGYAGSG